MMGSRILRLIACGVFIFAHRMAWAGCSINGGAEPSTSLFTLPSLTIAADTPPGTVIHSQEISGASINVYCTGGGDIYTGYTVFTDSDARTDNPLNYVYQTNVPGIGFRLGWRKDGQPMDENSLVTPMHKGVSTTEKTTYIIQSNATAQIVVTGVVEPGIIDTNMLNADWLYNQTVVARVRFAPVVVNVTANTCSLVEKNITVPLKTITTSDIVQGYSDVVSDDSFRIQLTQCGAGIKVDYSFTSAGSTGVSGNSDILEIASGSGAAEGIGLQILDGNNNVLRFDNEYTAAPQTTDGQSVTIPLKARYAQTGAIKPGKVDAVATFSVYYR
ncbi:type 1 fimbrial protein [Salmonella enterica]|nr:type 1 fimbrial protein [Salmonella enterica]EDZ3573326.1 fimbrial protein [Salmonella enterica]